MKNKAELELIYIRLKKESDDLHYQEIKERKSSNNAIKIAQIRKKNVEIFNECKELEKIILEDKEIPERIYRFGRWYIAEQEIKNAAVEVKK